MKNCDNCAGNRVIETTRFDTVRDGSVVTHGTRCNDCGYSTTNPEEVSVVIL